MLTICTLNKIISHCSSSFQPALRSCMSSMASTIDLSGIMPPIPTPFKPGDCSIWFEKLEENFEKWNKCDFTGYVVLGSNGEYPFITPEERVELVRAAKKFAGGKKIVVGAGCEATKDTISMCQSMSEAGADALLIATPFFYKSGMTDAAMLSHYRAVASASTRPIVLYNVPANTGIELSANAVIQLAKHPNIIGLKDSGGDVTKLAAIVRDTKEDNFQVIAGSASFLLPAYSVGAVGGICALANVLGDSVCQLSSLIKAGKWQEAGELQRDLVAPNNVVTRQFGVPGLKTAMEWFGLYGGPCREPLQPLTSVQYESVRSAFEKAGYL